MPLIDPAQLKTRLRVPGRFDVDALDACDSTNSEMSRRAAGGAPRGTVIVADCQSAGRGRRGRQWSSTPEASLTFSVLWRFPGPATRLAGLSLAVGLALARALESLGASGVRLKWPNDLLLERDGQFAKLGGILVELSSERLATQAVIGIGINLLPPPEEFAFAASGLSDAFVAVPERHVLLAAILDELAAVLDHFEATGFAALKADWQCYNAWQGRPVKVLDEARAPIEGRCLGVDEEGVLLLETASGVERIYAGDVSLRPA